VKRKRLTAEERKISILEATMRVVARLNYDSATISLIAKEARINQALIYTHFKSKQDLQLVMLDYIYETLLKRYTDTPLNSDPSKEMTSIQAFAYLYHNNRQEEGRFRSCVVKALVAIDPKIREKAWEIVNEEHAFIAGGLADDLKKGYYEKNFDIDTAAWWVIASDLLFSTLYIMGKTDVIPKERVFDSIKYTEKKLKPVKKEISDKD